MGVEVPLCVVVTLYQNVVMFSGVKLSVGLFVLFIGRVSLYFVNLHLSNHKGIRKLANNLEMILNLRSRSQTRSGQPQKVTKSWTQNT